jgi:hypothetical protein
MPMQHDNGIDIGYDINNVPVDSCSKNAGPEYWKDSILPSAYHWRVHFPNGCIQTCGDGHVDRQRDCQWWLCSTQQRSTTDLACQGDRDIQLLTQISSNPLSLFGRQPPQDLVWCTVCVREVLFSRIQTVILNNIGGHSGRDGIQMDVNILPSTLSIQSADSLSDRQRQIIN